MSDRALEPDPAAHDAPADALGWVGVERESAQTQRLRESLEARSGLAGLEVLEPDEIERAKRIFYRDGFVVVRNALTRDQLEFLRGGCDRVMRDILAKDKQRVGNRGSHRYSFGAASATRNQLHQPEWAMLLDLPTITPIVTALFESSDYWVRGSGGDFCLGGAVAYQPLHSDLQDRIDLPNIKVGSFKDPRGLLTYRDLPCPYVCCNFLLEDATAINGPTRQIPATQHSRQPIPSLTEEPEWMRLSTVWPAPAGSALIRDVRAWHGGTPNLTDSARAIPNAEFFAPWFLEPVKRSLPRDLYDGLSDHGQHICRQVVVPPGEEPDTRILENLGRI